jgi:hypothetical protein
MLKHGANKIAKITTKEATQQPTKAAQQRKDHFLSSECPK